MKGQESFHASRSGWCRGCHRRYPKGANIWSPAKGGGAFHIHCQPAVATRQATPEEITSLRTRSQLRKQGIYSN